MPSRRILHANGFPDVEFKHSKIVLENYATDEHSNSPVNVVQAVMLTKCDGEEHYHTFLGTFEEGSTPGSIKFRAHRTGISLSLHDGFGEG